MQDNTSRSSVHKVPVAKRIALAKSLGAVVLRTGAMHRQPDIPDIPDIRTARAVGTAHDLDHSGYLGAGSGHINRRRWFRHDEPQIAARRLASTPDSVAEMLVDAPGVVIRARRRRAKRYCLGWRSNRDLEGLNELLSNRSGRHGRI
jgi:hypothetical protein